MEGLLQIKCLPNILTQWALITILQVTGKASSPCYRWENWGTKMLINLPMVTELASAKAEIPTRPCGWDFMFWKHIIHHGMLYATKPCLSVLLLTFLHSGIHLPVTCSPPWKYSTWKMPSNCHFHFCLYLHDRTVQTFGHSTSICFPLSCLLSTFLCLCFPPPLLEVFTVNFLVCMSCYIEMVNLMTISHLLS